MAKKIELREQNRSTWNARKIPDNYDSLLERVKAKSMKPGEDNREDVVEVESISEMAVINNTGLKEITGIISFKGTEIDSLVITPSGVILQFKVDTTDEKFDFEWWSFAVKNYRIVMSTSEARKKLADFLGVDLKSIKSTLAFKGKKVEDKDEISLTELMDIIYP